MRYEKGGGETREFAFPSVLGVRTRIGCPIRITAVF